MLVQGASEWMTFRTKKNKVAPLSTIIIILWQKATIDKTKPAHFIRKANQEQIVFMNMAIRWECEPSMQVQP